LQLPPFSTAILYSLPALQCFSWQQQQQLDSQVMAMKATRLTRLRLLSQPELQRWQQQHDSSRCREVASAAVSS
jgi:hypothetical protein